MSIKSGDEYVGAATQQVLLQKTATRVSVALSPFGVFDLAGTPQTGALAVGNTTNGIVPDDGLPGYPVIDAFPIGKTGILGAVEFANSVAGRLTVYDTVFSAGAFNFNQNAALTTPPSFASRAQIAASWLASTAYAVGDMVVNGTNGYMCITAGTSAASGGPAGTGQSLADGSCVWRYIRPGINYKTCELWLECVTAFTGNPSLNVTFTDELGNTGRTTGTIALGFAPTVGRMFKMPLTQASGISAISGTIAMTVATAGTFNLHILRRLWSGRVRIANDGDTHGPDLTGMPVVFDNSALRLVVTPDSTSTGTPDVTMTIKAG